MEAIVCVLGLDSDLILSFLCVELRGPNRKFALKFGRVLVVQQRGGSAQRSGVGKGERSRTWSTANRFQTFNSLLLLLLPLLLLMMQVLMLLPPPLLLLQQSCDGTGQSSLQPTPTPSLPPSSHKHTEYCTAGTAARDGSG